MANSLGKLRWTSIWRTSDKYSSACRSIQRGHTSLETSLLSTPRYGNHQPCVKNIGTFYVHELFWMPQWSAMYCFNHKLRLFLCEIGYWCTLMKTRTAAHSWFVPHTTDSLFFVFPSDIWCKINQLFKYHEYQLTKRSLEGRLEGFKVSSWFLKIMKVVEGRIA